jgi:hypothetical protein
MSASDVHKMFACICLTYFFVGFGLSFLQCTVEDNVHFMDNMLEEQLGRSIIFYVSNFW